MQSTDGTLDGSNSQTHRVLVIDSLARYTDQQLDRVTASANIFMDRRWLRLIDSLDLAPLVRGDLAYRYAVVTQGSEPVAICPFFVSRSQTIHFAYSFRKAFFTGWQDELLREKPAMAQVVAWLSRLISAYRTLARATGVHTDGWVLAVSPLSFRGGIAIAPLASEFRSRVRHLVFDELKAIARQENLPLCMFCIPGEEAELREAALAEEMQEAFLTYDTYIELTGLSLDDYLNRFRNRQRAHLKKEIEKVRRADIRFEVTDRFGSLGITLASLYEATYMKFGPEFFAHPASFWEALERYLGTQAQAILAYRNQELLGFSMLFDKGGKSDPFMYRVGKLSTEDLSHLYFSLVFYEPIRCIAARGRRRLWLGPSALTTKHHRGAIAHPLYGYFWFPTRRSRLFLRPYLETFTRFTYQQFAFVNAPHANVKSALS